VPCRYQNALIRDIRSEESIRGVADISVTSSPGMVWRAEIESEVEVSLTEVKKLPISKRILQNHAGNLSITDDGGGYVAIKAFLVTGA